MTQSPRVKYHPPIINIPKARKIATIAVMIRVQGITVEKIKVRSQEAKTLRIPYERLTNFFPSFDQFSIIVT